MSEPKIIKGAVGGVSAVKEESWWETVKVIAQALPSQNIRRTKTIH